MLNQNHPDDERLSALASHDTDATDDAALTSHVATCDRCTELVNELGVLRAALGELPDVAPSRPLQLLPPVGASSEPAADRLGGWVRRFFAPVVASGAALALVGVIGTAAPALQGSAPTAGSAPGAQEEITIPAASSAGEPAGGAEGDVFAESSDSAQRDLTEAQASDGGAGLYATDDVAAAQESPATAAGGADEDLGRTSIEQERSPWPMVLFAGVAVMIGALLARWILAPRAP